MTFYNNILYVIFSYFCESTMANTENLQNISSSTFSSRKTNLLPDYLLLYLILVSLIVLVSLAYIVLGREKLPSSYSQPESTTHHSVSPSPSNISTRNYTGIDSTPISRKFYRKFNSPSLKIKPSSTGKINNLEKLVKKIGNSQKQFQNQVIKLFQKLQTVPSHSESEEENLKQELINLRNPYYRPSSEGETFPTYLLKDPHLHTITKDSKVNSNKMTTRKRFQLTLIINHHHHLHQQLQENHQVLAQIAKKIIGKVNVHHQKVPLIILPQINLYLHHPHLHQILHLHPNPSSPNRETEEGSEENDGFYHKTPSPII